jgi:hypothetical protein
MNERQTYSRCTPNEQLWHDVCNTASNQQNHITMRTPNTILAALVLAFMTSLVGITQVHNWTQLATAVFGAAISLGLIGLIATEK